jgi:hypothetical protein
MLWKGAMVWIMLKFISRAVLYEAQGGRGGGAEEGGREGQGEGREREKGGKREGW